MYQYYPKILYSVNEFDKIKAVDITKSAKVKNLILSSSDSNYLRRYVVQNGERPDIVSFKLYDSPKYEYLLLLVNNIVSIYDDWPKDYETFNKYIEEKYGSISYAMSNYAYHYTSEGVIVSEEYWQSLSGSSKYRETFFEYETRLNIKKARIKVLDFPYIIQFETGLRELL
jgi:hypothetical protein